MICGLTGCYEGTIGRAQRFLGSYLRDHFFYPPPRSKFSEEEYAAARTIFNPSVQDPIFHPNKAEVLSLFNISEEIIPLDYEGERLQVKAKVIESKFPNAEGDFHTVLRIGGADEDLELCPIRLMPFLEAIYDQVSDDLSAVRQNVRIVQISPFDIVKEGESWGLPTFSDMSFLTFDLLKEFRERGWGIQAMICNSLGSAALELIDLMGAGVVPKMIILDRALPSTWKAGNSLNVLLRYTICFLAGLLGWTGNPEESIIRFFERLKNQPEPPDLSQWQIVLLEAKEDFYFSGQGGFDPHFAERIRAIGARVFRLEGMPNRMRFHVRAHHALPLNFFANQRGETIEQDGFSLLPQESWASAIARQAMLRP